MYIIDTYAQYDNNSDVVQTFHINSHLYCIRKIDQLFWGSPQFPARKVDDENSTWQIFSTLEEAQAAVMELKRCAEQKI